MKTGQERCDAAEAVCNAPGATDNKTAAARQEGRRGDSRARLERFLWMAARISKAYRREQ